jgi:sterol desaturase/sphingolipid hydroxylase (fatty acid hydroxylase superfamily)
MSDAVTQELLPWLGGLLAVVLIAASLEGLVQTCVRRQAYDWRAFATSMADLLGRRALDALGISLAAPLFAWAYAHRLDTIELSNVCAIAVLFIGQEFLYYWYHRAAHRVAWFWATHCVHHSPNQLTLASALRLGWTGKLTGNSLFFLPLVGIGFPPVAVLSVVAANLLYQFWLHATWIPKLGVLEWVFNTPSHHRVHHGSNPEYLDCNYGGVLIVFDRLFGTFVEERDDIAIRYGLVEPITSYNPLRINLHGWTSLAQQCMQTTGWRQRVTVLFAPPGRHPEAPGR